MIEIYDCTEAEKSAFFNKIKFNGMKVGRIDKMFNFVNNNYRDIEWNYFKGQIIRMDGISDSFQFIDNIASEINKGIFIKSEVTA